MFIELHQKSGMSPIIIGLHHIVKIVAAPEGGTVVELAPPPCTPPNLMPM